MSSNKPRAVIHVGAPAKSFSAAEGYEPERRGWDEKMYKAKNSGTNNHYDFTRKHLNFEINNKGDIVPLSSNPIPLHERLKQRLDELGFKPYRDKDNPLGNSDNSPNCTVGIIVSGDHDVLTRLAFGEQDVDFSLQRSNAEVQLQQGIRDWAMDTYHWACDRWGAENIIGFDVHLDETTPHIHIQMIPVAKTKTRGRASVKYVHKDDKSKVLLQKDWKKLSEESRSDYVRTEVERREKESVSYAKVWGADKHEVGRTYYKMHTDYHREVGYKYGLERGDAFFSLTEEEQRGRVHKEKDVLEAERKSQEAIAKAQMSNERLTLQNERIEAENQQVREQNDKARQELSTLEQYIKALTPDVEGLNIPKLNVDNLVNDAWKSIKEELSKPIPQFRQAKWKDERRIAIKQILTDMQTELMQAKEAQTQDILKFGKVLYQKAMKDANAIIEQNKQLQKQNGRLIEENDLLRQRIASIDENAISRMRSQKDAKINELQKQLDKAERQAVHSDNTASRERQRADKAESRVREMLSIPEIKEIWEDIQRNKKDFLKLIDRWIEDGVAAIREYTEGKTNDFQPKQGNAVAWGIIAEAFRCGLNPTDEKQRRRAAAYLLERLSWTGISQFKADLTATRTRQLSDAMTVSKDLMANLLLVAGGRGDISTGGGGSTSELTNWDGTKKKPGWGI